MPKNQPPFFWAGTVRIAPETLHKPPFFSGEHFFALWDVTFHGVISVLETCARYQSGHQQAVMHYVGYIGAMCVLVQCYFHCFIR